MLFWISSYTVWSNVRLTGWQWWLSFFEERRGCEGWGLKGWRAHIAMFYDQIGLVTLWPIHWALTIAWAHIYTQAFRYDSVTHISIRIGALRVVSASFSASHCPRSTGLFALKRSLMWKKTNENAENDEKGHIYTCGCTEVDRHWWERKPPFQTHSALIIVNVSVHLQRHIRFKLGDLTVKRE